MPRLLPPENIAKAAIQARYRAKLLANGEPEADRVDIALAAAVAAYADAIEDGAASDHDRRVLRILLQGAISILKADGFNPELAVKVIRRRLSRDVRHDLAQLSTDSKIRTRMSKS